VARSLKLCPIRTPTDIRRVVGCHSSTVNWLIPGVPAIEGAVRRAVDAILCDLQYVDHDDAALLSSYLESIEEPLSDLAETGFTLSYALSTGTYTTGEIRIENWTNLAFVVSEFPLIFSCSEEAVRPSLHIANSCELTERRLILAEGEGVIVFSRQAVLADWFDCEELWCKACWSSMDRMRIELKAHFLHGHDCQQQSEEETFTSMIQRLLVGGENEHVEFKSSLIWDVNQDKYNLAMREEVLKEICAFLNADGGIIVCGVDDIGEILGLSKDIRHAGNRDKLALMITNALGDLVRPNPVELVTLRFVEIDGHTVLVVSVQADPVHRYESPSTRRDDLGKNLSRTYVRMHSAARTLEGGDLLAWWERRKSKLNP